MTAAGISTTVADGGVVVVAVGERVGDGARRDHAPVAAARVEHRQLAVRRLRQRVGGFQQGRRFRDGAPTGSITCPTVIGPSTAQFGVASRSTPRRRSLRV